MPLWLVLMLMTIAALAAVVWPIAFAGRTAPSGSDVAIYKDQLIEIDRDREAGSIGTADADAARLEVSHRLLKAAEASETPNQLSVGGSNTKVRRLTALAMGMVFLPTFAGGMYLRLGSPGTVRMEVADQTTSSSDDVVDGMVAQVESYLKGKPNDGHGWEILAPIYMRMGRYDDSARAWQKAITGLGDSSDREENLGEALVAAANGVVTNEARRAFNQALSIDPTSVDAGFYIGLAAKQDGRPDEAARIWRGLIDTAPPDADWLDTVRNALARLDAPSVAAADDASAPEKQQDAMIRSMVEGLSERLKINGGDLDGWLRLVRSYKVLRERDKADAAIVNARRALASDPEKLARLEMGLASIDRPLDGVSREVSKQPAPTTAGPAEHDSAPVQAMVDKLAERLSRKGGDVDSWLMLVRSYETLGEHKKATAATAQARSTFASDPQKLVDFNQRLGAIDDASGPPVANTSPRRDNPPAPTNTSPTEEQQAMIKGMVDRLADRLTRNGNDVDGWIQLMRSYVVLGQRDQASAAARSGRAALGNDTEALHRLDAGAKGLGVDLP